jgi:hypothetical protein
MTTALESAGIGRAGSAGSDILNRSRRLVEEDHDTSLDALMSFVGDHAGSMTSANLILDA